MPKIADLHNLYLAFHKASRGKRLRAACRNFGARLDQELAQMRMELLEGAVPVGKYHFFTIYDPKERRICAADFRERVLHHALMNVCHPIFERVQIYDSYASRKGKGTHAALDRARHFARKYEWHYKMDVRKYFDSIPQGLLMEQLERLFKEKPLLDLFARILASYQGQAPGVGLPIGNLTSQYFANHYLSRADHFAYEALGAKGYVRYMDDMVLWDSDKRHLMDKGRGLAAFIHDDLQLELKPPAVNRSGKGLGFLGYRVFGNKMELTQRSKYRFLRKLARCERNLSAGIWSQREYSRHTSPLFAFARHARTRGFLHRALLSCPPQG